MVNFVAKRNRFMLLFINTKKEKKESKTIKRNKQKGHTKAIFRFQKCLMLNSWVIEWQTSKIRSDLLPIKQHIFHPKNRLKVLISLVSNRAEFTQYTFLCQRSQLWLLCYDSINFLKSNCIKLKENRFFSILCRWRMHGKKWNQFFSLCSLLEPHSIHLSSVRFSWVHRKWWRNFGLSLKFGHIVNNLNHLIRNAGVL